MSSEAEAEYFEAYRAARASGPAPDAQLDVETSYGTVRVYRYGSGPPIVLLHGFNTSAAMWAPFLPAFAARHTVYTMDALGEAGASVQTAPFAVAADRARALDEVFAELGLTGVHLVGASGGGWLAVNQVLHAPDRVATLSLLDPTTVVTQFSFGVMWRAVLMTVLRSKRLLRRLVVYSAGVDVMDRPEVRVTLVGARTYQLRLPMSAPPPRDALRAIRLPVLAVFAGRSSVHNSALAAHRARELMPHASVEVWPEARHDMGAFDDTRPITDRVLAFLG